MSRDVIGLFLSVRFSVDSSYCYELVRLQLEDKLLVRRGVVL
jgi:hypothetical protein